MRGQDEILAFLGGSDLDQEGLHMAAGLILRERVVIHMLVPLCRIVREPDTIGLAILLRHTTGPSSAWSSKNVPKRTPNTRAI